MMNEKMLTCMVLLAFKDVTTEEIYSYSLCYDTDDLKEVSSKMIQQLVGSVCKSFVDTGKEMPDFVKSRLKDTIVIRVGYLDGIHMTEDYKELTLHQESYILDLIDDYTKKDEEKE